MGSSGRRGQTIAVAVARLCSATDGETKMATPSGINRRRRSTHVELDDPIRLLSRTAFHAFTEAPWRLIFVFVPD